MMKNIKEYFNFPQNKSLENKEFSSTKQNKSTDINIKSDNVTIEFTNHEKNNQLSTFSEIIENENLNEENLSNIKPPNAFQILMNKKSTSPKDDLHNIRKTKFVKKNKVEIELNNSDIVTDDKSSLKLCKNEMRKGIAEENKISISRKRKKHIKQSNNSEIEEISNHVSPKSSLTNKNNTHIQKENYKTKDDHDFIEVEALVHTPPRNINLNNHKRIINSTSTPISKENSDFNSSQEINSPPISKKPKTPKWKIRLNLPPITKEDEEVIVNISSSSDESLFSPYKKRKLIDNENEYSQNNKKICLPLAPIFQQKITGLEDNIKIKSNKLPEAKLKFLHSGLPKNIQKKDISLQSSDLILEDYLFPKIPTILQKDNDPIWNLTEPDLKLKYFEEFDMEYDLDYKNLSNFLKLNNLESKENLTLCLPKLLEKDKLTIFKTSAKIDETLLATLQDKSFTIKEKKKSIKNSRVSRDKAIQFHKEFFNCWSEKYKPKNANEVIGNSSAVDKIGTWLDSWKTYSEQMSIIKKNQSKKIDFDLDSSNNFFYNSNDESSDEENNPLNALLVIGEYGLGKTATIYALAEEKGFKVLELNCSSTKRSGKKLLAEFLEATQSHQVPSTNITNFFKNITTESNGIIKEDSDTKKNESKNKALSLILIEDVDLVFDDFDDGFINGLNNLIQSAKRPIVLIANDSQLPHMLKLSEGKEVIMYKIPDYNEISKWLQLICVSENVPVNQESILSIVQLYKGDIRRCLMELQFWILSGGEINPPNFEHNFTINSKCEIRKPLFGYFPDMACIYSNIDSILNVKDIKKQCNVEKSNPKHSENLSILANLFDSIAWIDTTSYHFDKNTSEPTSFAWSLPSRAGVSLHSNNSLWDSGKNEILPSIASWLSERCVITSCIQLQGNHSINEDSFEKSYIEIQSLIDSNTSCIKQRKLSQLHSTDRKCFSGISLNSHLDRKSLSCDYLPFFRDIARSENKRFFINSKRKNRFFHYFKSLGVHIDEFNLEILQNKLIFSDNIEESDNKMKT